MLISYNNCISSPKHFRHMTQHEWPFKLRHSIHLSTADNGKKRLHSEHNNERRKKENESNRLCGNPYSVFVFFFFRYAVCITHECLNEINKLWRPSSSMVQFRHNFRILFSKTFKCLLKTFLFRRFRLLSSSILHSSRITHTHAHPQTVFSDHYYVDQCSVFGGHRQK